MTIDAIAPPKIKFLKNCYFLHSVMIQQELAWLQMTEICVLLKIN